MIEPHDDLSVRRQCELLKLARSGVYFQPTPLAEEDLVICKELDKLHLEFPASGSRMLSRLLKAQGQMVNRSGRGPARWCTGCPLAVSAVSGFVPV
jgi:putative transposase